MRIILTLLLALLGATIQTGAVRAQALQLVMVEEPGCIYCARWNAEVGPEYPITDEGKAAPLLRVDKRAQPPEGAEFGRRAVYTPTFILLADGVETARIEGYPGEDFFWGLLNRMIDDARATHE